MDNLSYTKKNINHAYYIARFYSYIMNIHDYFIEELKKEKTL